MNTLSRDFQRCAAVRRARHINVLLTFALAAALAYAFNTKVEAMNQDQHLFLSCLPSSVAKLNTALGGKP